MGLPLLSQPLNADRDYTLTVLDSTGAPATSYTAADPLSAVVWAGDDATPLATPLVTWVTPSQGVALLTISKADTAALAVETYRLRVDLTHLGRTFPVFDGLLELTDAPGVAAALPVYGTFEDMTRLAPWVANKTGGTDQAGFAEQRALAREWFDDLLQRHYRGPQGLATDYRFGWGRWGGLGWNGLGWYRDGATSKDLRDWLAAGGLVVEPQVKRAVAYHAIAAVARGLVSPSKDSPFAEYASSYGKMAERAASLITASIDTNADGIADMTIRLGVTDTLEG